MAIKRGSNLEEPEISKDFYLFGRRLQIAKYVHILQENTQKLKQYSSAGFAQCIPILSYLTY